MSDNNSGKPGSAGGKKTAGYPARYLAAAFILECVVLLALAEAFPCRPAL